MLQREYHSMCCPICLSDFEYGDDKQEQPFDQDTVRSISSLSAKAEDETAEKESEKEALTDSSSKRVDKFGIPVRGADGKRIKLLRCGHIFCETCWRQWVHSGCGNPCNCPVCRQDVGKTPSKRSSSSSSVRRSLRSNRPDQGGQISNETVLSHPTYDTVSRARADAQSTTRLLESNSSQETGERTPLLSPPSPQLSDLADETIV